MIKLYTPEDDASILANYNKITLVSLANLLGRTTSSVYKRAKILAAPGYQSSWTDERTAEAVKLWQMGLSATEIAKEIGGTTRNAVISKIHRLGMTMRGNPTAPVWDDEMVDRLKTLLGDGATVSAAAEALGITKMSAYHRARKAGIKIKVPTPKASVAETNVYSLPPRRTRNRAEPVAATPDQPGTATVLNVTAHQCRWPIGDPASEDFTLCGQLKFQGSYCRAHAARAYLPRVEKPKTTPDYNERRHFGSLQRRFAGFSE